MKLYCTEEIKKEIIILENEYKTEILYYNNLIFSILQGMTYENYNNFSFELVKRFIKYNSTFTDITSIECFMTDHTVSSDRSGGFSRRNFLSSSFNGFGALALGGALTADLRADVRVNPLKVQLPHIQRKAKHCIFMFFGGGVSQMDSFEYKPVLNKLHGKPLSRIPEISGELQGRLSFPHATVQKPE